MTKIAFYAPMKSPNHPVPSGDREMARGLMAALQDETQDASVSLVSEFRSYEGRGNTDTQKELFATAEQEVARLSAVGGWDAWVTYHNYYKAPDLIGPVVAKALGIPYLLIEATRAAKRLGGPWDQFARAADVASDAADAIFYMTALDLEGLSPYRRNGQPLVHLPPFIRAEALPETPAARSETLLSVAMMRSGDKLASYAIIADALKHLEGDWVYEIAGDGPARPEIEAMFAAFGDRVQFLGQLDAEALMSAYARARAFLWPGVNEAFGMVYLEAQASGLPVVAQDRPGVRDVVPASGLVPVDDASALARRIGALMSDPSHWQARCGEAKDMIAQHHLLTSARNRLWSVLGPLLEDRE
ncbi:glycosyltransferase [uncultured Shimia sp.]|uniref:glycosyltransferase family 4 protein n=1 Tax=uncultured Shimia sp. TaxID=573152 RepID=UPI0026306147|nr:glycosyltransferase [uncultured Shimia sp.]